MRRGRPGLVLLLGLAALSLVACGGHAAPIDRAIPPTIPTQSGAGTRSPSSDSKGTSGALSRRATGREQAAHHRLVTYINSRYGFSLRIPADLSPKPSKGPWSVETSVGYGGTTGTPVVSIPVFAVNHGGVATGQPYPLFFYAEVHVGVSENTADCYRTPPSGRAGRGVQDEVIGGVTFRAQPVEDAGMMKYLKAVSYRVIHDGRCFAVEQIARGSSYRDSSMKPGLSQAQLDAYYEEAATIVHSFRFIAAPASGSAEGFTKTR